MRKDLFRGKDEDLELLVDQRRKAGKFLDAQARGRRELNCFQLLIASAIEIPRVTGIAPGQGGMGVTLVAAE